MNNHEPIFANAKIIVIDDNPQNVRLVERLLEWAGYSDVSVLTSSTDALELLHATTPDLVLLDLHMPKPDGFDILEILRQEAKFASVPVLVFTADITAETRSKALAAGASDFLTKPGDTNEILLRVRNFLALRRLHVHAENRSAELESWVQIRTSELATARREALVALARAGEFRDEDTGSHTMRVGELSATIAQRMGLTDDYVDALRLAATLHDVGKVGLPDGILLKCGLLSHEEREIMQTHTHIGAQILANLESPLMKLAREIAFGHHERWDGSGYPLGLSGSTIPKSARIVAVADVYDALVSERPYKHAWSHDDAVEEILKQSGIQFDPEVVEAFVGLSHSTMQRAA